MQPGEFAGRLGEDAADDLRAGLAELACSAQARPGERDLPAAAEQAIAASSTSNARSARQPFPPGLIAFAQITQPGSGIQAKTAIQMLTQNESLLARPRLGRGHDPS